MPRGSARRVVLRLAAGRVSTARWCRCCSAMWSARRRLGSRRIRRRCGRCWPGIFERMSGIVERHGGSVEKFIGDAVVAVFGVPVVHEDDALRACRAAVEMREAFAGLGIEGRIGVSTGEVVTGTEERLATGDALNVAARLQQAAQAGGGVDRRDDAGARRWRGRCGAARAVAVEGEARAGAGFPAARGPRGARAATRHGVRRSRARAGVGGRGVGTGSRRSSAASWSRSSVMRVSASPGWRRRRSTRSRRGSSAAAACRMGSGSPTGRSWRS